MKRKLVACVAAALCLMFTAAAGAENATLSRSGNRVSGQVSAGGWTFPVDAWLITAPSLGGDVICTPAAFDRTTWEQALAACFPETGAALGKRLTVANGMASASLRYVGFSEMYPAVLPASLQETDDALERALAAGLAFCQAVGLQVDGQPLSCAWILENDQGIRITLQPGEAVSSSQERLMEVWLPLCADGSALVPNVQVPRYHGTANFTGSDSLLARDPGVRFLFDGQGALLSLRASLLEITVIQTATEGLDWQEALETFLAEYTQNPQVQMLLEAAPYTVSSIRSAWDLTEANTGSRGWMITLTSRVPRADSPTGWRDRYYTAFVYGEPS